MAADVAPIKDVVTDKGDALVVVGDLLQVWDTGGSCRQAGLEALQSE